MDKKYFLNLILIILVIILAGALIYVSFTKDNYSTEQSVINNIKNTQKDIKQNVSSTSDSLSLNNNISIKNENDQKNIKTYTNYGFSIDYPSDWIAREEVGAQDTTIIILSPEHEKFLKENPNAMYKGQYTDFRITLDDYPWVPANKNLVLKNVKFNGVDVLKYEYDGMYSSETYVIPNYKTKTFLLTHLSFAENDSVRKSILSSFRLTE